MKIFYLFALLALFLLPLASAHAEVSQTAPCRMMDVHCQCENPASDFVIGKQKVGKANDTELGVCQSAKDITNLLDSYPTLYCANGKNYIKNQTRCKATWTCLENCDGKSLDSAGKNH